MIAFVTTIRHPQNSNDYRRVGQLLSNTLRSVLGQLDADLQVIVVHNELPDVSIIDKRIHYVQVDFPAPSQQSGAIIDFPAFTRDKGTKCAIGVSAARDIGADHVMFFDADDLISNQVATLANNQPTHPGWYFNSGYIHSVGTRSIQLVADGFHEKNGSTSVIKTELIGLPESVRRDSTQQEILDSAGSHLIDHLMGKHGYWQDHVRPAGHVMEPLPFPGAIWMIGTGENVSGNLISGRDRQPITPEMTVEFALDRPTLPESAMANTKLKIAQAKRKLGR